ncbi:MAG: CerR family C-terminal domain-containing protein, partial [Burkholderiales bacterium]|nr:CerR family C-terminal domain-containing protein [Burkholderiales bacterium]
GDDPVTRTVAFLGIHQALYIRLADSMLMHRMGWDAITPERIESLLDTIAQALRAQLMHYPEHRA